MGSNLWYYLLDKESPTNTSCLNLFDVIKKVVRGFDLYFMRHRLRQWIKFGGKFPDFKEKEEPVSWRKWWRISHGDVALGPRSKFQFDESNRFWVILVSNHPYSIHTPSIFHPCWSFFAILCISHIATGATGPTHGPKTIAPEVERIRFSGDFESIIGENAEQFLQELRWSWALGVMGVMRHLWLQFQWTKCEEILWKDDKHGDVEWVLLCDVVWL